MIPVANKPILFYAIEDVIEAGAKEIGIIVGPNKEQVMETVRSVDWNASIDFIYQDEPKGLAHTILVAEDFLDDEFVMYLGDNMLREGIVEHANKFKANNYDASIMLTEVDNPQQFGVADINGNGTIKRLVEKPKVPPSNLALVGIYFFKPVILEACKSIKPSWRNELEITDAIQWLIENGYEVGWTKVNGWWKDTGKPDDIFEVYGDIDKGSFKEDDMLKPSSPYSASKASADLIVMAYVRTYGLDAVITRCTNNYGMYQFPEKLIPKAIIRAKKDMKIPIYGTGKNVRDWIYVKDHCEAINLVLEKGEKGEIYNISSGEEKTNLEVVSAILGIMDKPDLVEFVEDRPGHDIRYSLDSSKISGLGWKPKHGFEDGLKETVEWYLENEWWWQHLTDERILHPTPWKLKW